MSVPAYGQYEIPTVDKCVNFKIGQPSPSMLPLDKIRKAAAAKLEETDPNFLQYGNIYGFPKFRESLSKFLTARLNLAVPESQLFATNGNTGALCLLLSIFCKGGDLVYAEDPTYFLAKSIFKDYKLNCRQVAMDDSGLDVDLLEKDLDSLEARNEQKPVLMYIVPTAHNPTGRTLTKERRAKLVEVAKKHKMLLICDEVYHLLTFPHITPPPPMNAFDPDGETVISIGSFSKILCPALRVGWIQSGGKILKALANSGQLDSSGGLNPVSFGIVQKCIDLGLLDEHLNSTREILFQRYSALKTPLEKAVQQVPGMSFEEPQGGYFVLVKLPEGVDAAEVLKVASKNKVMFLPGGGFSTRMTNCLRLSFSMYDKDDITVGVERLVASVKEYMASK